MKQRVCMFALLLMSSVFALAQSTVNLIIFSEDGDPFFAYVNGVKQNNNPETNVKITNLSPNISLRIVFENAALPQLKQTMALDPGMEHTARIKRDAKQQVKLRYFGSVPLAEAATGIKTVNYHSAEDNTNYNTAPANEQVTHNQSTTVTNNTQQDAGNGNGSVSVNISLPGVGINMNVNDPTMTSNGSTTITSSTSSSTTTSTSYNSSNNSSQQTQQRQPAQVEEQRSTSSSVCTSAMSDASFAKMKENIDSKPFSETKMSTAKVATKNACLSTNQIKEIAKLFSMDEDKLTYTKYAYDRCVDKANFYQASEVFSFSSTVDEFNAFLETK